MVKSEHGSPLLNPTSNLEQLNGQLPPLDFSLAGDYGYLQNLDTFSSVADTEPPIFSAGLSSASIDWSHYDGLDFNNDNFAASSYSQAASFTGFDFSSCDQPALTSTSTSGEISEVEDFLSDMARPAMHSNQYGSDYNSDYGGEVEKYRLSTASSYGGLSQPQVAANNVEPFDLEEFLLKGTSNNGFGDNNGLPIISGGYTEKSNHTSPFDGLPMMSGNSSQSQSPFDEAAFQLLQGEEEIDWSNTFANNGAINIGDFREPEDNIWAAQ